MSKTVAAENPTSDKQAPSRFLRGLKNAGISLGVAIAFLVLCEIVLRIFNFHHEPQRRPISVPDGSMAMHGDHFIFRPFQLQSPDYYWLHVPDGRYSNDYGFVGKPFSIEKPPGIIRIVALGDSCTEQTISPYTECLERLLTVGTETKRFEVLNAGVGSASSFQGLKIFEKKVLPLQPDVVTIYFGWNDHWVSYSGIRDSQVMLPREWQKRLSKKLVNVRLFQFVTWLANKWGGEPKPQPRVTLDEYRANHLRIVRECRKRGIRPILMTAPHGFDVRTAERLFPTLLQPPDDYRPENATKIAVSIHDQYNEVIRALAAEEKVDLIDLDKLFRAEDSERMFMLDGIHHTQIGLERVAQMMVDAFAKFGLISQEQHRRILEHYNSFDYVFSLGKRFLEERDCAEAIRQLEIARSMRPDHPEIERLIAEAKRQQPIAEGLRLAVGHLYSGNWGEAVKIYQNVLQLDASLSVPYSRMGWIYHMSGLRESNPQRQQALIQQSIKFYEAAIERDPRNDDALYHYAMLLQQIGRPQDSLRYWEKLLNVYPQYPRQIQYPFH